MATYPYMIHISPPDIPSASVGASQIDAMSTSLGGVRGFTAVQNDYREYSILTAGGTWRLTIFSDTNSSRGIITVTIDGVSIGTIDCYGAAADDIATQFSGIALNAGNHLLRLTCSTKNASSSGYVAVVQHISLLRTGA